MTLDQTLGILGTGALGGAIARGILRSGTVSPDRLVLANQSGRLRGFEEWPDLAVNTDVALLGGRCGIILLALPPKATQGLTLPYDKALILSVMAGVTLAQLRKITGSVRVVRGMSNPAADIGLAYSPWVASAEVSEEDRRHVRAIYSGFGLADEVGDEDQIDHFTAITGPVPGFVAYFADCVAAYAMTNGIAPAVAVRAVLQPFRASGLLMAEAGTPPSVHVDDMMRYAGTTASGLQAMQSSPLKRIIADGLDAAVEKAKSIANDR